MSAHPPALSSFWLMPAEADAHLLAAIVGDLSARFAAPAFAPHLTIAGDLEAAPDALAGALALVASATRSFSVPVVDVVTGSSYFRSLFALFDRSRAFDELRRAARFAGTDGAAGDFMPHVSLLYGHPASGEKSTAAEQLRRELAGRDITFDRLAVTNSSQTTPIGEWRIVEAVRLG